MSSLPPRTRFHKDGCCCLVRNWNGFESISKRLLICCHWTLATAKTQYSAVFSYYWSSNFRLFILITHLWTICLNSVVDVNQHQEYCYQQCHSARNYFRIYQETYKEKVITFSRIIYGKPDPWHDYKESGRKIIGYNIERHFSSKD